jgi:GT2 family glycosyltransferase
MPTANVEAVTPKRRGQLLDLLSEPLTNVGIRRDGNDFVVEQPWQVARFGQFTLRRGWWVFDCKGYGGFETAELRLVSPEDRMLAFSVRRAEKSRTLFHTDKAFDVSLLVSAWPGRYGFTLLRLRRLSLAEEVRLARDVLSRWANADKPFSKLLHVASRVASGRSIWLQSASTPTPKAIPRVSLNDAVGQIRTIVHGDVTAVLREDERLHPRATEIVAQTFSRSPELHVVYADLSEGGQVRPKPEWDADLAAVSNYADSPMFFRGAVAPNEIWSRFQALAAQPGAIARIALPLASREVAIVKPISPPKSPRLPNTPLVSVVIPTKIRIDLLERCLEGLVERTGYPALEVVIVNGCSEHPRFETVIAQASAKLRLVRVDDTGSFNFSRLINLGVRNSAGDIILLLNDDVEAIESGWLHRMVESIIAPGVGCVGARLLYPNRTIQHAGITLGVSGVCGHLWKGLNMEEAALIPQVVLPSQRMAVTGACLAVRRELFDRVGGLDEISFPISFNDVDFCLRIRALGYRTVYRGDVALIHHESQSRGLDDANMESRKRLTSETAAFLDRWREVLFDDPFGSPAFDPLLESGAIHPSLSEEEGESLRPNAHRPRRGG